MNYLIESCWVLYAQSLVELLSAHLVLILEEHANLSMCTVTKKEKCL